MPYKHKIDSAVQLSGHYSKHMHIHTDACTIAGIHTSSRCAHFAQVSPKISPCRCSLVSWPKPAPLATEWGKGGVSCGAAALPWGWHIPTGLHNLLILMVVKKGKGTESSDNTTDTPDSNLQQSLQSSSVTCKPHEKQQFRTALTNYKSHCLRA